MTQSNYTLEKYRLGELSPAEHAAVEAALDDGDRERLAALKAEDAEILSRYPARVMALQIHERRRRGSRRTWMPILGGGLALAGAAAAVLLALNVGPNPSGDPFAGIDTSADGVRIKGPPRLLVFAQAEPTLPLPADAVVHPGDTVQVKLNTSEAGNHAALFSIDGSGVVTRHLVSKDGHSVEVEPGKTLPLGRAYTLDDAPEFERFFLIIHAEPFSTDPIEASLRDLAQSPDADHIPFTLDGYHVVDHLLRKVSP